MEVLVWEGGVGLAPRGTSEGEGGGGASLTAPPPREFSTPRILQRENPNGNSPAAPPTPTPPESHPRSRPSSLSRHHSAPGCVMTRRAHWALLGAEAHVTRGRVGHEASNPTGRTDGHTVFTLDREGPSSGVERGGGCGLHSKTRFNSPAAGDTGRAEVRRHNPPPPPPAPTMPGSPPPPPPWGR